MLLGFKRRVEEHYLDLDRMRDEGKIDPEVDQSPAGYYPTIIVPKYLMGKVVVVMPLDDKETPISVDEAVGLNKIRQEEKEKER